MAKPSLEAVAPDSAVLANLSGFHTFAAAERCRCGRPLTAAWRVTFSVGLLITCAGPSVAQTKTPEPAAPPTVTITPTVTGPSSRGCEHEATAPVLIRRVEPEYTKDARKGGLEGRVVLEAIIAADGSVENIRVLKSATYSLDQFAMNAVRQWRYKPALCGDRPVRVYLTVTVTFSLNRGKKR